MTDFRITVVVDPNPAVRGSQRVRRELGETSRAANSLNRNLNRAFTVVGIGGLTAAIAGLTVNTLRFNTALAETSTLVTGTDFDMRRLESAILDQSAAFGSLPAQQTAAAYQIISAGAGSAEEAITLLDASNRLAIGGVTDIRIAADGLTSVLNAYGLAADNATDVSDTFFIGVRAGKTTVDELATSLGRVAPLAASAGVNFQELTASVSALTTGGISTREAVTGVRAILASVVRPTVEAQEAAQRLGLEFNASALQAQGFEQFLSTIIERTGGSTSELAQLFGGVEALVPILALTGEAGQSFAEILEQLEDRAGATQEAFEQLENSPAFQLSRLTAGINAEFTRLSNGLLNSLVPAIRAFADNIDIVVRGVLSLSGAILVPLVARAIPALILALGRLSVVLAANPLTAFLSLIGLATAAFITFSDRIQLSADSSVTAFDLIFVSFEALVETIRTGLEFIGALFGQFDSDLGELSLMDLAINFANGLDIIRAGFIGVFAFIENLVKTTINRITQGVVLAFEQLAGDTANLLQRLTPGGQLAQQLGFDAGELLGLDNVDLGSGIVFDDVEFDNPFEALNMSIEEALSEAPSMRLLVRLFQRAEERASSRREIERETNQLISQRPDVNEDGSVSGSTIQGLEDRNALIQRSIENLEQEARVLSLVGDARDIEIARLELEERIRQELRQANEDLTEEQINNLARLNAEEVAAFEIAQQQLLIAQRRAALENQLNGVRRNSEQTIAAANALLSEGTITQQQYADTVRDAAIAQREFNIAAGTGTFADAFIVQLDRMAGSLRSFSVEAGTLLGQTFDQLGSRIADTIGRGIFDVNNLGEAFKSVARDAISGLISSLIQLGIQFVANQVLANTLGAAATGSSVAQAGLIASAYAPAAAFASLATLGANALPANAALVGTVGLAQTLASVGAAFADGADFITGPGGPRSDRLLAALSPGEGVVTARANRANRGAVGFMNDGGTVEPAGRAKQVTVNFNFPPGTDVDSFRRSQGQVLRETQRALDAL